LKDFSISTPQVHEEYAENELFLIPFTRQVLDSQTANAKYLAELRHSNPLWLHPRRAARMGLDDGDQVRLETSEGVIKVKIWITQAIHPDCAAIALGHGHTKIGRVALAQTIAKYDPMTKALLSRKNFFFTPFTFRLNCWDKKEPIWWHKDGNGWHFNFLFSGKPNQLDSGLTVINPLVKIWKA
jgi:anaerobic selenocysteine-containing dehydrogenase